jgi:UDPglucose--hexose-1-phosphate uridylyltransferase
VVADDRAVAFAPFAARVPFETWIVASDHCGPLEGVDDGSLYGVARHLRDVLRRMDRALLSPPYTLLLHAAPVEDAQPVAIEPRRDLPAPPPGNPDAALRTSDSGPGTSDSGLRTPHSALRTSHSYFHWHIEVIPRLLPVPGLAWDGGIHINPVPPEEAAQALREAQS